MAFNYYPFNFTNLSRAPNNMEYIVPGMEGKHIDYPNTLLDFEEPTIW